MSAAWIHGGEEAGVAWLCFRSQRRRERLAASALSREPEVEAVFAPEIRVRRRTRRGPVWFVEALFPGYLFAEVGAESSVRRLTSLHGVTGVVSFDGLPARVDDDVIGSLRAAYPASGVIEVDHALSPGEEVTVVSGPLRGFAARVLECRSSDGRVAVLLDIMGRPTRAVMDRDALESAQPRPPSHPMASATA